MTGYRTVFDRENLKLGWSHSNCEFSGFLETLGMFPTDYVVCNWLSLYHMMSEISSVWPENDMPLANFILFILTVSFSDTALGLVQVTVLGWTRKWKAQFFAVAV